MLDAGGYPITFARFAFGEEPVAVQAAVQIDPDYGVDSRASIILTFSEDRQATLQSGLDALGGPAATLFGEAGYIEIPQPCHPKEQSHFTIHTPDGAEVIEFDNKVVPFTPALEQFHDCVVDGATPLATADNAIGTLRVFNAALESAIPANA